MIATPHRWATEPRTVPERDRNAHVALPFRRALNDFSRPIPGLCDECHALLGITNHYVTCSRFKSAGTKGAEE